MERIYLDHAATSPVCKEAVEAMLPYFTEKFGNPSSIHRAGRTARSLVDSARRTIAASIHAKEKEIIFTSGGTEADNLAVIGTAYANQEKGKHIITTSIEHHAVLNTCKQLEKEGFQVTYLPVDHTGRIAVRDLEAAITDETILVTVMYGNNEVGTLQPIHEIGELLHEKDILFHTDAVQAYGFEKLDVRELNVDLLSVSSHKINGPKGIGFLYVKDGTPIRPHLYGGEQERKRRAGTENVAALAGFKRAVEISQEFGQDKAREYEGFQQVMQEVFIEEGISFEVNGHREHRLPHIFNIFLPGISVESMLINLDLSGVEASSGSACTAGSVDPSHVITAMFPHDENRAKASIRFSFGLGNTTEQVIKAAKEAAKCVKRISK